jgi:hypothetical protein
VSEPAAALGLHEAISNLMLAPARAGSGVLLLSRGGRPIPCWKMKGTDPPTAASIVWYTRLAGPTRNRPVTEGALTWLGRRRVRPRAWSRRAGRSPRAGRE